MEGISLRLLAHGPAPEQAGTNRMRFGKNDEAVENASPPSNAGSVLGNFGDALKHQMNTINAAQAEANTAQETYATGGDIELHNVMIATEKAELSLQLAMQIRNKAVAAYQEISHMSI